MRKTTMKIAVALIVGTCVSLASASCFACSGLPCVTVGPFVVFRAGVSYPLPAAYTPVTLPVSCTPTVVAPIAPPVAVGCVPIPPAASQPIPPASSPIPPACAPIPPALAPTPPAVSTTSATVVSFSAPVQPVICLPCARK